MAGTKAGAIKAAQTNKRNNPNFYAEIGAIGGRKTGMKGFALNRELASIAGKKGGTISRKGNGTNQYVKNEKGYFTKLIGAFK